MLYHGDTLTTHSLRLQALQVSENIDGFSPTEICIVPSNTMRVKVSGMRPPGLFHLSFSKSCVQYVVTSAIGFDLQVLRANQEK